MGSRAKAVSGGVFAALIAVQLVPANRSNPAVTMDVPAPVGVKSVLRRSCYDCHSNETRWPWYAHVAPASWITAHDVSRARERMNFSSWDRVTSKAQHAFMRSIVHHVVKDHMPPWYYRLAHSGTSLTAEEQTLVREWAIGMSRAARLRRPAAP